MISVGIVNFNKDNSIPIKLVTKLANMGYAVYMIHYYDNYINIIEKMEEIKYWFFSGSDYMPNLKSSPQMNEKILQIKGKKFMMICYSMEIFAKLLGCTLKQHDKNQQTMSSFDDAFLSTTIDAWRNHKFYLPVSNIHDKMILLGSFKDQVMTAKYVDKSEFLLIQWHPPYTEDGEQLLEKWID